MPRATLPIPEMSATLIKRRRTDLRRRLRKLRRQMGNLPRTMLEDELSAELLELGAQLRRHENARTVAARRGKKSAP